MTGQSIVPNFPVSEGLRARFRRSENAANTALQVNMHRRGATPPTTSKTNDVTPAAPRYYLVVGGDGARAYFPFEETSGSIAYDAVTIDNVGVYHGSVVHITGPIAVQAPDTDGAVRTTVDDSIVAPSPIAPGPGSWELWLRTSGTVGSPTLIAHLTSGPDDPGSATTTKIFLNSDGSLTAGSYDDTDTLQYDDDHPDVVNNSQWHHVVAVDSGTAMLLYVDGSLT